MLKAFLRRVRGFMQAEVMAELATLRAELAQRDQAAEAALLAIALHATEPPPPETTLR